MAFADLSTAPGSSICLRGAGGQQRQHENRTHREIAVSPGSR